MTEPGRHTEDVLEENYTREKKLGCSKKAGSYSSQISRSRNKAEKREATIASPRLHTRQRAVRQTHKAS